MSLRLALVGCGGVARGSHLPGWEKVEDLEFVAMCDKDRARADDVRQRPCESGRVRPEVRLPRIL